MLRPRHKIFCLLVTAHRGLVTALIPYPKVCVLRFPERRLRRKLSFHDGPHQDDILELVWRYEAVLVSVEILESLSKTLVLEPFHKLGKLIVCLFVSQLPRQQTLRTYSLRHVFRRAFLDVA